MNIDQKIVERFNELIINGEEVLKTKYDRSGGGVIYMGDLGVNSQSSHEWGIKTLHLLSTVFGKESDYYERFNEIFPKFHNYSPISKALGILKGAKDDYEKGYLFETKTLIRAEVFGDFLEQAEHLLKQGYHPPAAVVAGCVLEDGLRQLCAKKGIELSEKPKLDFMNSQLAKANVYNGLTQKNITASADLRNKAAHGQWEDFNAEDVKGMISQVRVFMERHFS